MSVRALLTIRHRQCLVSNALFRGDERLGSVRRRLNGVDRCADRAKLPPMVPKPAETVRGAVP